MPDRFLVGRLAVLDVKRVPFQCNVLYLFVELRQDRQRAQPLASDAGFPQAQADLRADWSLDALESDVLVRLVVPVLWLFLEAEPLVLVGSRVLRGQVVSDF